MQVLEDGVEQSGVTLHKDDAPVSICLILDISGSMWEDRNAVMEASRRLINNLGPEDEVEIVSFSIPTYVEQQFTTDRTKIVAALRTLKFQGGSALYDAVSASVDELKKPPLPSFSPVVVIISDEDDNYSHISLQTLLHKLATPDATAIYSLCPPGASKKGQSTATFLAAATGGVAIEPGKWDPLSESAANLPRDIHNRYKLEYTPDAHAKRWEAA